MASKTNAQKIQQSRSQPIISTEAMIAAADLQHVSPSQIRFSPFNYRQHMDQTALEEFAAEILVHGILSPLLVRTTSDAGFELLAGERRLRAALMAGLSSVPVLVAQLDDEMVCEVQLAENLQRENPHPLHESQAIARMQKAGKTIDEIAARLGKSRKFVYSRIKLSELIEPFQQILFAAKMGVQQAYEIARLSAASQHQMFEQYCSDWQQEHFQMPSAHVISRFRCDLTRAPFDITIDNLVPATPACTGCPLNSATLKSLFPELATEAVCSGLDCYQSKVRAHFAQQIHLVTRDFNPDALVYTHAGKLEELSPVLDQAETLKDLPRYSRWGIRELVCPVVPESNDVSANDFMSQQEAEAARLSEIEDYEQQLSDYQNALASAECMRGLLISEKDVRVIDFLPDNRHSTVATQLPTARQFQEAVRDGTLTAENVEAEIKRVQAKQDRSIQLDREKVQLAMHTAFIERFGVPEANDSLTKADEVAIRLIVFQSLDYQLRYQVSEALGLNAEALSAERYFETLAGLSQMQFAYMLRMAVAGNSESKRPQSINGWSLRAVAAEGGLDVETIEQTQQKVAHSRGEKVRLRLLELQQRKEQLPAADRSDQVYN
ncbi:MAG: hypothetical protein BGO21_20585 [Dyadobacter sp. 50-39]|uniref:ParB/RepB/Spo0J family partition protein n=1 Tax=Dyadobacter sp. 50-39 TaxID=1895756 RepID=UPI00095E40A0|nr:ParB/RepB/Spo0J family partition protein [Dyadobacter sp. 50-39]OJV19109.1 MAG: hypothetical protein BGO21_20585 [Dyadobacter sp. 50-39]